MKDKMDKLTMEIGNKMKSMDMVYILGLTEVDMKDIILMERGKGKGKWYIPIMKYMKVNGYKVKNMAKDICAHKSKILLVFGKIAI